MAATYFGYFIAGGALIAVGLVGSAVTGNLTLAFIVSSILCGLVVSFGGLGDLIPSTSAGRAAHFVSFSERFGDFGRGVVALENVGYFVGLAAIGLWANVFVINKRHWAGSRGSAARSALAVVRAAAWLVAAGAMVVLLSRAGARADTTQERLWSLSPETVKIVDQIDPNRPVLITAYVSPEVPTAFVQTRDTLLGLLRDLEGRSGGRVITRVLDTEPFSDNAREAKKNFGIEPQTIPPSPEDTEPRAREVFLGVAFTCGPEQTVVPFLSKGVPVEYEFARSIRTVTATNRKKVGILETDAQLFGEFNYQTFQPGRDWPIVDELRKQYEVTRVAKGQPVPADINVLLVAQPSSLTDADLTHVTDYVKAGRPALIFEDPLCLNNPPLSTSEPRGGGNPMQRRQPNEAPKANLKPLYAALGIDVPANRIAGDVFNPRPQFADIPPEFCFIAKANGSADAFNESQALTSGLQEAVLMCAAPITIVTPPPPGVNVVPLLKTGTRSFTVDYAQMLERTPFGVRGLNSNRRAVASPAPLVLGVRITSSGDTKGPNAIFFSDIDCISEMFFRIREQGFSDLEFDNVTLVLNAVDTLAGEESLVDLRKHRRQHRTLERLDEARSGEQKDQVAAVEAASAKADAELQRAKDNLNAKVKEIEQNNELDENTKAMMVASVRDTEQRRLDVQTASINDAKSSEINDARAKAKQRIDKVQMNIRLAAVLLPPIPALLLAGVVFANRRRQELSGVARDRLR